MASQYAYGTKANVQIVAIWCNGCGIPYGLPEGFIALRQKDHATWTCPNGCQRRYAPGKSDAQKLKEAQATAAARELALKDQLGAAIREGDEARTEVLRIRQRIANGVCPCCTRTFPDVMAHMATKHPDYALPKNVKHTTDVEFRCSCGRTFQTFQGLRIHQGTQRGDGWDSPETSRWSSHLSVV